MVYMKTNINLRWYEAQFFLEWEMFQIKFVEKIKTYVLFSMAFFPENRVICEIKCKKYGRTEQATGDYMAHCTLNT